jgi:predicted transcriptional regulator
MAVMQNITLRVPKPLLKRLKTIATERGISVSALVRAALRDVDERLAQYADARKRSLAAMARPTDLGSHGQAPRSRDQMHER